MIKNKLLAVVIFLLLFMFDIYSYSKFEVSNIVYPVQNFVNHDNFLKAISENFKKYNKIGVQGVAGIGKTQLLRKYAFVNQDHYRIIWFFDSSSSFPEQFSWLAKEINKKILPDISISESPLYAMEEVIKFLTPRQEWLLIFDNLGINENDKVVDFQNWEHNGRVIFCSQDSDNLPNVIRLEPLSDEDSKRLISLYLNDSNQELAHDLIKEFKGHPLLITNAAMFINNNNYMNVKEYDSVIKTSSDKLFQHVIMVYQNLSVSAQDMLNKISMIDNQRFSKNFLRTIVGDTMSFNKDLYSLIRYGLIANMTTDKSNIVFEMHDEIKNKLQQILKEKDRSINLSEMIENISKIFPIGKINPFLSVLDDAELVSHLIKILKSSEQQDIGFRQIFELKRVLVSLYLFSSNVRGYKDLTEWFEKNSKNYKDNFFDSEKNKAIYSDYLKVVGICRELQDKKVLSEISLLEAKEVADSLMDYNDLKFAIDMQLSQNYIGLGNISKAEDIQNNTVVINNNDDNADVGLFWYNWGKINLSKGLYERALKDFDIVISLQQNMAPGLFTIPAVNMKANALNNLGKFQEAYKISIENYNLAREKKKKDHEIHARILIELATSELGAGNTLSALSHIQEAKNILLQSEDWKNSTKLALAYAIEAEIQYSLQEYYKAQDLYSKAEAMYYKKYRENIKNFDEVAKMYVGAVKASKYLADDFWYNKFKNQLIDKFGVDHPRAIKLMSETKSSL